MNTKGAVYVETKFARHYDGSTDDQEVEFPIKGRGINNIPDGVYALGTGD